MAVFGSRAARASDARELGVPRPVVDVLRRLAQNKKAPPSQIALAWLLGQKPWIVPSPGTRRRDHVNQDLDSIHVQVSPAEVQELEASDAGIKTHSGRIDEVQMRIVGRSIWSSQSNIKSPVSCAFANGWVDRKTANGRRRLGSVVAASHGPMATKPTLSST